MTLLARVRAETVSRVDSKMDQIAMELLGFRSEIGGFWFVHPFNTRAHRVDQLRLKPFGHDFFVIGRIWAVAIRVRLRLRSGLRHLDKRQTTCANKQRKAFHGTHFASAKQIRPAQ